MFIIGQIFHEIPRFSKTQLRYNFILQTTFRTGQNWTKIFKLFILPFCTNFSLQRRISEVNKVNFQPLKNKPYRLKSLLLIYIIGLKRQIGPEF